MSHVCDTLSAPMLDVSSRERWVRLTDAVNAIAHSVALGFACRHDDGRDPFATTHGRGEFVFPDVDLPAVLRPGVDRVQEIDRASIRANRCAHSGFLFDSVERLVSVPVRRDVATCFWIGLADSMPLSADQVMSILALAEANAALVEESASAVHDQIAEQARELRAQATNLE